MELVTVKELYKNRDFKRLILFAKKKTENLP